MASADYITVAVRVRPAVAREEKSSVIRMEGATTELIDPRTGAVNRRFTFDHSLWSFDKEAPTYVSQQSVYKLMGEQLLESALEGYNVTMFAYGQTGSGKTFSMLGTADEPGITPRFVEGLFNSCALSSSAGASTGFTPTQGVSAGGASVEVSYMEIYMEQIRDLLNPSDSRRGGLKVREHPNRGPYVEDLSTTVCSSSEQVTTLLNQGSAVRSVGATRLNAESSRSHAIFTITLTQREIIEEGGEARVSERVSRVHLVDLAGSERSKRTHSSGQRLQEAGAINKSLSTLGTVISALASDKGGHVPYRDSVLTWLLKDGLGGNARTSMLANISPSTADVAETLSTLRYADSAKRIANHATINVDPSQKLVTELKKEIDTLKAKLASMSAAGETELELNKIREELALSEKLKAEAEMSWEEKLRQTQQVAEQREQMLSMMQGQMAELEKQLAEAERTRLEGEAVRAELEAKLNMSAAATTPAKQPHAAASDDDGSADEMPQEFSTATASRTAPRFPPSPSGVWYSVHDFDGEVYYWNPATGETTWDLPHSAVVLAAAPGTAPSSHADAADPSPHHAPPAAASDGAPSESDGSADEMPAEFAAQVRAPPAAAGASPPPPDASPPPAPAAPAGGGAWRSPAAARGGAWRSPEDSGREVRPPVRPPARGERRLALTAAARAGEADSDDEVDPHFLSRVLQQLQKQDRTLSSLQIQLEQAELMLQKEQCSSISEAMAQARTRKWSRAATSLRAAIALLSPSRAPGAIASAIAAAGACRREGWLLKAKRSRTNPDKREWRRRWFLLKDDCLLYFENVGQGKPQGALDITGAHVFAYLCEPEPERVCFNVESRGRIYNLASEDKPTAEDWVAAITNSRAGAEPDVRLTYTLAD